MDTALHVAAIMDGNGRWATRRGLSRSAGHRAGAIAVRRVVEAACDAQVGALTLFAFSSDNWRRPDAEVSTLMTVFALHLRTEAARMASHGVRLEVIGRRDRLPPRLVAAIERAEATTANGRVLHFRLAVDYSARHAIARGDTIPDVDLLIRTGGEQRLSDFLLWESAYAELYFTETMWPEFGAAEFRRALDAFRRRDRRFGGLSQDAARSTA